MLQKERWRHSWLASLNELTSLDLQRESWLDKSNTNPHWSFVEFMSCYFDDLGIDNGYGYQLKNDWISSHELEIITGWHELLAEYKTPNRNNNDLNSILVDEKWIEITRKGRVTVFELKKALNNEKEIQILTEEINYKKYN